MKENPIKNKYNQDYRKLAAKSIYQVQKYIYDQLKQEGFSHESAVAIVGNLTHESARFSAFEEGKANAHNTKGLGISQWTDNPKGKDYRGKAFVSWMEKNGYEQTSLEGNVKYLIHEMKHGYYTSGEEGKGKRSSIYTNQGSYNKLKNQDDINEANQVYLKTALRPASINGQFLGYKERLVYANTFDDNAKIKANTKAFEELSPEESSKVYQEYMKKMKDIGDGTDEETRKKQNDLKKEYQLQYGIDNLNKGRENFDADRELEFAGRFEKEHEAVKKAKDAYTKAKKSGNEKDIAKAKNQILFAKSRFLSAVNKDALNKAEEKIKNFQGDVDSEEFIKLEKERNQLKKNLDYYDKSIRFNYSFSRGPKLRKSETEFVGDAENVNKSFDYLFNQFKSDPISAVDVEGTKIYDESHEKNIDDSVNADGKGKDSNNTSTTETSSDLQFIIDDDNEIIEKPSMFKDDLDNQEKQSIKGYLRDNPMAPLQLALGLKGLADSQSTVGDLSVDDNSQLDASWYEYLDKVTQLSKQGLTPEEEADALKRINDNYANALEVVKRASGGNRALFLSQQGQLNARKNEAILNLAVEDAKLNRANLQQLQSALEYTNSFNERKSVREMENDYRQKNFEVQLGLQRRKSGANLAASSLKSIVDSINSYRETGEGSALSRYLKFKEKEIEKKLTKINPETGLPFANETEYSNLVKSKKENSSRLRELLPSMQKRMATWEGKQVDKDFMKNVFNNSEQSKQVEIGNWLINPESKLEDFESVFGPKTNQ